MSSINFNSTWFRCYSKAKFESDSEALHIYVKLALDAISEALTQPDLDDGERKALSVATEDLRLMERQELPSFPNPAAPKYGRPHR